MSALIEKIDILLLQLERLLPMSPESRKRLERKLRLEISFNSNHIEDKTITYGETELLLIFGRTIGSHDIREYDEMKAHDAAFELIKEWAGDNERQLTEMALKNLHKILLVKSFWKEALTSDGQATRRLIKVGDYREQPISIRLQTGELFHYASPAEVPILIGELIQWYRDEEGKKELHPVILSALLHYRFVRIHPFDDGNGRIARLLMNYVLFKHNIPPVIIKSADKKNYLFALNQADSGNIDPFIQYIAEQLIWSIELHIKAANGETLDEKNDLQKEISNWKKGIAVQKVNVHRNDIVVYQLYNSGFKKMLESFSQQHQDFLDMFHKAEITVYKNNMLCPDLNRLTEQITEIFIKNYFDETDESPKQISAEDTQRIIWMNISLQEYRYSSTNPFSISSDLRIFFQPYKYLVQYNERIILEKVYDEFLLFEEIEKMVRNCVEDVFNQIKIEAAR